MIGAVLLTRAPRIQNRRNLPYGGTILPCCIRRARDNSRRTKLDTRHSRRNDHLGVRLPIDNNRFFQQMDFPIVAAKPRIRSQERPLTTLSHVRTILAMRHSSYIICSAHQSARWDGPSCSNMALCELVWEKMRGWNQDGSSRWGGRGRTICHRAGGWNIGPGRPW